MTGPSEPPELEVYIDIFGDTACLTVAESTIEVPASAVIFDGGNLFIRATGEFSAALPAKTLRIVSTDDQVAATVDQLNPLLVTALMAEESAYSPLDDPIGLVAIRAVVRAIRGDSPNPDTIDTLE